MVSLEFTSKMTGQHMMMPRWQKCVTMTKASLPLALGSLYVSRFFKEESKREAVDMVNAIRSQFNTILGEIDWMDPSTKRKARYVGNISVALLHIFYHQSEGKQDDRAYWVSF